MKINQSSQKDESCYSSFYDGIIYIITVQYFSKLDRIKGVICFY